jgi:hypothetical protein
MPNSSDNSESNRNSGTQRKIPAKPAFQHRVKRFEDVPESPRPSRKMGPRKQFPYTVCHAM